MLPTLDYDDYYFPNIGSLRFDQFCGRVFQTLVVLKLHGYILLKFADSPVCFLSLKSLHLNCVDFKNEESFATLLSACPVLEDLFLQRLCDVGHFLFSISVPSLQRLFLTMEQAYLC
ncbi:putative F-box/FBD/LRR-repeat protein [Cardamine amara subsp. amara]|uniref:F-box/FBD/LRR-repeat protein n=1 Tax=Cardamine amara subsp. amara TaxID=228776 RepID=A0ABD1BJR2_CARAN